MSDQSSNDYIPFEAHFAFTPTTRFEMHYKTSISVVKSLFRIRSQSVRSVYVVTCGAALKRF